MQEQEFDELYYNILKIASYAGSKEFDDLAGSENAIVLASKIFEALQEDPDLLDYPAENLQDGIVAGALKILRNNAKVTMGLEQPKGGRKSINIELEFNNWINGLPSLWGSISKSKINKWVATIGFTRDESNLPILHISKKTFGGNN